MSNFHFGGVSLLRMKGLNQKVINLLNLAIVRTPVDFGIAFDGGFRTAEKQWELYKKGASKKDGFKLKSKHQSGMAVDLMPYIGNQPTPTKENYLKIYTCLMECSKELGYKLRSGMDWDMDLELLTDQDFDDMPHFEIIN